MLLITAVVAAFVADRSMQMTLYRRANVDALKLVATTRIAVLASLPIFLASRHVQRLLGIDRLTSTEARRKAVIVTGTVVFIVGLVAPNLLVAILLPLGPTLGNAP
jgi:hypothetical protein